MKNAEEKVLTAASENLLTRYLKSFQDNDVEAILNDYSEHSMLITTKETYQGIAEIRDFFIDLMVGFAKQNSIPELNKVTVYNEHAFVVWHAKRTAVKIIPGTDTLVIKNNKIWQHRLSSIW